MIFLGQNPYRQRVELSVFQNQFCWSKHSKTYL